MKTLDELERRAKLLPSDREKRRARALAGVLALDRGDTRQAIAGPERRPESNVAPGARRDATSPRTFRFGLRSLGVPRGGHLVDAAAVFKILSTESRGASTIRSSRRSLYFLGQIAEPAGRPQKRPSITAASASTGATATSIATRSPRAEKLGET